MISLNFLLLSGVYLLLFGGTEAVKRLGGVSPVLTRKMLHIASALVACVLPFLISPSKFASWVSFLPAPWPFQNTSRF